MSDVTVEYDSPIPARYKAEAIAWKNEVCVASGKEKHVAHELCHIAQQLQGRVKPTMQLGGIPVNDELKLEREADDMGAKALVISQYNPGTKQGQELTPVVQQNNSGNIIQRAVGFEFQTNWGVSKKLPEQESHPRQGILKKIIPTKNKSKRKAFSPRNTLHDYNGFKMTTDVANTSKECEIEWIVAPIEEAQGVQAVQQIMQRLQTTVASLVAFQGKEKFTLDKASHNPEDSDVELYPNIKGKEMGANMKANPQVTAGVRLDQMAKIFAHLGEPNTADKSYRQVAYDLSSAGGQGLLKKSEQAANKIEGSASLKGLATQIICYLKAGALTENFKGENYTNNQAYSYAKLIGKIMARTDFGSQFKLLPPEDRQRFENDPQSFVTMILDVAEVGDGNTNVFERKIRFDPQDPNKGVIDIPVTRNLWLINIPQGQDMLTKKMIAEHGQDLSRRLGAMGAMGDQTDQVGPNNVPAPIVEFRQVKQQMPYTDWGPFAVRVFEYLTELNRG